MKVFNLKQKSLLSMLVMLCMSLSAASQTLIDGVYYNLVNGWTNYYYDSNGNYQSGNFYQRAAFVTYDPSVEPWSVNNNDTYQGDIVIPDKVTKDGIDYSVVAVDYSAFRNCKSLTSVQLPSSVVMINSSAFSDCTNLSSVTMPGVISLEGSAFNYSGLTSLVLPKSLKSINGDMFRYMGNLASITIDEDNESYKSVDGVLYDKNVTKIVGYPAKKGGTYQIPSTVTIIKSGSFPDNVSIDELIVPASVTKIESSAFGYNLQIKKLTIEDGDTELTIGTGSNSTWFYDDKGNGFDIYPMFYYTLNELYWGRPLKYSSAYSSPFAQSNLNKVTFGTKVTSIPKYTFYNCYSLNKVDVKGGIGQWCSFDFTDLYTSPFSCAMIGGGMYPEAVVLFNGSELSGAVVVPDDVTSIPSHGFQYGCSGITDLTLPAGVTSIADGAFKGLSSLSTIQLAAANTSFVVDNNVLYNKEKTKILCFPQLRAGDYVVPSTITELGDYQFYNCVNLTGITLPNTIKVIPQYAFAGCTGLSTITIPASVETIQEYAFFGCSGLANVSLHDNVKSIKGMAFNGCNNIVNVKINVHNLSAFCNNTIMQAIRNQIGKPVYLFDQSDDEIKDLVIPSDVTVIGDYAFAGCSGLATLTLNNGLKTIKSYAFTDCSQFASLTIPASVEDIYDYAFDNCTGITNLVIEDATTPLGMGKGSKPYNQDGHSGIFRHGLLWCSPVEDVYIGRNLELKDYDGSGYTGTSIYEWDWQYQTKSKSPFTSALTNVTIGNKVNRMPGGLFTECWGILSVNFDGTIIEWCNITFGDADATPFGKSGVSPILHLKGQPLHSQVNIPEGATKVGAYAFYGQNGVSNFTLPSTMQTIEPYAFYGAGDVYMNVNNIVSLENTNSFSGDIYVPDAVLSNYRNAAVWSGLAERIYPLGFLQVTVDLVAMTSSPALLPALNALEQVNGEYRITALTNLKIRGTMNGWDILMIRNKMPNLRVLDLSEATILDNDGGMEYYQGYHTTANTISAMSFYNLTNLRKVVLPQNITSIEYNAFYGCRNLQEVLYMPESCTRIGSSAFANSGLRSIIIGEGVRTIESGAFGNCNNLYDVTMGKNVKTIGGNAFYSCYNLTNLTLVKGLETIESNAFQNCSSLKNLVLPTTLRRIEYGAFESCSSLINIDFAEGLEYIGASAFSGCYNLKNLHLPTSLRYIENRAFNGCTGLSDVHVPSMLQQIGDYAFTGCGLRSVYAYTVTPIKINQNTFNYAGVDLYAPTNSFYAYYLNTQWSQFQDVKEFEALYTNWYTARNTDIEINLQRPIKNYDDSNPADGEMEPGSGLIFVGDGEQLVKNLILNWAHGDNYPSLIENGNLSVDELAFIMNVYPGRWYFFSFPFDVKLQNVKHNGKWVWRYYDAEARAENGAGGSWKNVTDGVLHANVGYIFQSNSAGDLELPVGNPDYTKQVKVLDNGEEGKAIELQTHQSNNAQDASWNFVGNPNTSYYHLDDMNENFTSPITVWDQEQQTYTAVVPGDDDYELHPFEAFFVQKGESSENVEFYQDCRETYQQSVANSARRAQRRASRAIDVNRLLVNVELSNGTSKDKTRVVFDDSKDMAYEIGTDANKFMSQASVPQIYTLDAKNVKYAVNNRPNMSREVRLGVSVPNDGDFSIDIPRMDFLMSLKDTETGMTHDFSTGAYIFHATAGTYDNRFLLVPNTETTSISENGINGLDINAGNGNISVNGIGEEPVNIYNALGVRVAVLHASGSVELQNGTYIVGQGRKVTKVLVK